ncbi:RagB/SusD family nutrient uptake outer membrane protein [Xanthocytophaga flava]|uniref:RagB/SusD family nutrient uptake outer membrane protein n=1 Tax=Xanthocytophaga flava TaxID=3048013 RepID=UPI0028D3A0B5|nr:RagB/SusD family nutrient uptake outer membrane protein [Xanthocytophaga flavus]MDJ1473641.1 RagB/SusD family nutrient uptake outer membrane protein [Xanthocytophaga flavus]
MKRIILLLTTVLIASSSCKDQFLDHPSTTQPTTDNYYNTAEQVYGATGILYNRAWNDWSDKAFTSVGDVLGGTVSGVAGNTQYNSFYNFNIQSTDGLIGSTWNACYDAAGRASVLIQTFESKKGQIGDQPFLTVGIAEARFIRAFAYFYIGRTFGDVPIVPNPLDLTSPGKNLVPRYLQKDVLRFAIEDLEFAEANLPEIPYQAGRVTKISATGMMAKIYLYLKDYEKAKTKAKEVIDYAAANPSKLGLYPDYQAMFTSSSVAKGNIESLFSLQWVTAAGWDGANRFMTYAGPAPLLRPAPTNTTAAYSSVVPSIDMLDPATGYASDDRRRGWSVMEQGFFRADWKNANFPNGFVYDTTGPTDNFKIKTVTRSNIQKYIVGPNREGEPVSADAHSSMPTYILRYADILLIYAEATMGGSGTTSDAAALAAFNAVHTRAGLPAVTSITLDELLHERKVEFAFEGDYWFDIQRQGFAKASEMVAKQERGFYDDNRRLNSFKATLPASFSSLFLPIPQNETVSNPLLLEPAVPYYQ